MAKLIVTEFVTLDGVMEAPAVSRPTRTRGWTMTYHEGEHMQYKLEEMLAAETLLIGRVTYESFAGAWPELRGRVRRQDERACPRSSCRPR